MFICMQLEEGGRLAGANVDLEELGRRWLGSWALDTCHKKDDADFKSRMDGAVH